MGKPSPEVVEDGKGPGGAGVGGREVEARVLRSSNKAVICRKIVWASGRADVGKRPRGGRLRGGNHGGETMGVAESAGWRGKGWGGGSGDRCERKWELAKGNERVGGVKEGLLRSKCESWRLLLWVSSYTKAMHTKINDMP